MKNLFLLIITVTLSLSGIAQQGGSVRGNVSDTASNIFLSEATVSVLLAKDSSLVSYTVPSDNGDFILRNLAHDHFILLVTHSGYKSFSGSFTISPEKSAVDFGKIFLAKEYTMLEGVVVKEAPVKINGDTISFKADAFKTRPGAMVEDVLKKLPGVQVQKDGTVTAMGETVQKVLVDGKEFFGNDPKIATKNITAEIVDQIQVFDDMSEQAKFTKIDDGSRSKAINIKLKKNKNRGDFGRITAGAGTDERYEGNLSLNHFRGNQRISVVGSANNTNKQNYTFNNILSSASSLSQMGQGGGFFTGGNMNFSALNGGGGSTSGVSSPVTGGINYADQWMDKIDFRASYHYSGNKTFLDQEKFRHNSFTGDSSSETVTRGNTRIRNNSHRANFRWEYPIDSFNSVLYFANLNFQGTREQFHDSSFTYSKGILDYLAITASNDNADKRNGMMYSGELLYRRKFSKPGRTFTMGWRSGYNNNDAENYNLSPFNTYKPDGTVQDPLIINQYTSLESDSKTNTISTSYTEPIGKNKIIELNYAFTGSKNLSDKEGFDYDNGTGKYDKINLPQTNFFKHNNNSGRFGTNFRLAEKKYYLQLGMAIQVSKLSSRSVRAQTNTDTTITQRFTNLFPSANFGYNFNRSKNIRVFYRGRTNDPSVSQLQDVPDLSNPLQVRTGNPSLKQEFNNNINVNYSTFQMSSLRFFNANVNFSTTYNKIVNSIDSSSGNIVTYKPVNLNGSFTGTGFMALGFPLKKIKGANLNFTTIGFFSRDASLVFRKKNFTNLLTLTQTATVSYSLKKSDMGITGSMIYNKATYALQKSSSTSYFRYTWSADYSYRFENDFYFLTDLDYFINSGRTAGFNRNMFLWNISCARKFMDNKAEIKFTAYDILRQNTGINRIVNENYYEDSRANVVRGFFLLTVTYSFNRMGSRKEPDMPEQIKKMKEKGIQVFQ